jgi:serine/threonine protein kinase
MTDATPRLNTALSGRYHIESELGEGGMATVYLADDLRHERKVGGMWPVMELWSMPKGDPSPRMTCSGLGPEMKSARSA